MSDPPSFMDLAVKGEVLPGEVDDYIDFWHENVTDIELHDFLGLTVAEYSLFVNHPEYLNLVIAARIKRQPIMEAVNDNLRHEQRLAARSDDPGKVAALKRWIAAQPDR